MGLFSACEHDWKYLCKKTGLWNDKRVSYHKCSKCNREEKCHTFEEKYRFSDLTCVQCGECKWPNR